MLEKQFQKKFTPLPYKISIMAIFKTQIQSAHASETDKITIQLFNCMTDVKTGGLCDFSWLLEKVIGNSWPVYIIGDKKLSRWRKAWNKDRFGFFSDLLQDKTLLT